jgi:hypothetical protein
MLSTTRGAGQFEFVEHMVDTAIARAIPQFSMGGNSY